VQANGTPILYLNRPKDVTASGQRSHARISRAVAQPPHAEQVHRRELRTRLARIAAYELAFRMQTAAPEATDIMRESAETRKLYGIDDEKTRDFGTRCLIARRLTERGVRFVQVNFRQR